MKHTDKFDLNIIETTDAFSPEPLNENTQALEALLAAKAAQADFDGLAGRVGALETGRLLWKLGTYSGNGSYGSGSRNRLEFDFMPIAIIIINTTSPFTGSHLWIRNCARGITYGTGSAGSGHVLIAWGARTIEWYSTDHTEYQLNKSGVSYAYLVLGTED